MIHPYDTKASFADADSATIRQEMAVIKANRSKYEQLRKRRAEIEDAKFLKTQSREVWQ